MPKLAPLSTQRGFTMKEAWLKYGGVAVAAALVILFATNPTQAQFKVYVSGANPGFFAGLVNSMTCDDVQTSDWYIFSNYEHRCMTEMQQCTGVFNQFVCGKVKPKVEPATPA